MEKFGTFGDQATGVRPFIPIQNKIPGWKRLIFNIFGFFKLILSIPFFLTMFINPFIFQFVPISFLRIFITRVNHIIHGHIILFLCGNYFISATPTPLIKKIVEPEKWKKPKHGDVVFAPLNSFLDLIWYATKFSPNFLVPCKDESEYAILYSLFPLMFKVLFCKGNLQEESFFGRKVNINEFIKKSKENKLFANVIFPEGAQTNGTGLLKYESIKFTLPQDCIVQVLGFKRTFKGISPNRSSPNQPGLFSYLIQIFGRFYESASVLVAMEKDVKQPKEGQITPEYMEKIREITGKLLKLPLLSLGSEKHAQYCKQCLERGGEDKGAFESAKSKFE